MGGQLRIQAWPGKNSTEVRLVSKVCTVSINVIKYKSRTYGNLFMLDGLGILFNFLTFTYCLIMFLEQAPYVFNKKYSSRMLEESMAFYNRMQRHSLCNDQNLQSFILSAYNNRVYNLGDTDGNGLKLFEDLMRAYRTNASRASLGGAR